MIMEQVLLLNISYEPLNVINWKKAINMLFLGKVEVIEEYNNEIHSISFTFKMPSVVRMLSMVRKNKCPVKFSRQNIYARDRYTCQYCGVKSASEELTYDHVLPKSRGGKTEWENIVTSCMACNRKKGGRMPHEASMRLIRRPFQPDWVPSVRITIGFKRVPQSWRDYLYWHVELIE
jgi:5-methylcytosine-specific restriction endonuclease McrA